MLGQQGHEHRAHVACSAGHENSHCLFLHERSRRILPAAVVPNAASAMRAAASVIPIVAPVILIAAQNLR
jgi:hypothetical protein